MLIHRQNSYASLGNRCPGRREAHSRGTGQHIKKSSLYKSFSRFILIHGSPDRVNAPPHTHSCINDGQNYYLFHTDLRMDTIIDCIRRLAILEQFNSTQWQIVQHNLNINERKKPNTCSTTNEMPRRSQMTRLAVPHPLEFRRTRSMYSIKS
jgi:hypothetical protein